MRLANKISLAMLGLMVLSGCNKDEPAPVPPAPPPPATFTVGGTLSGLNGSVTLANNGGDSRALSANGAFTFPTAAQNGAAYNVTVTAQPANQTCAVTSGTGTVAAANVSAIAVTCVTNTFTVGGSVAGLSGGGLVLRNNAGNDLTRDVDGAFTFTNSVAAGGAYAVTIATQPANQDCTLANASGVVAAANVSNVTVTCATFRVTGVVGPAGGSLVGPDGVEVHIPAGALAQPTTIGIARSPGGWPEPLIAEATRFGSIYELTPHDVIFDKPVIIRLPAPNGATDPYALVSSFNEGWQRTDVAINGNYAEMERNVFSWLYMVGACGFNVGELYPCWLPRGYSFATATPANAISMTSGVPELEGDFYMQASAGTWAVDSSLLTTLHINMEYSAAPDCANAHVQLKRLVPGANPPTQIVSEYAVPLDPQGKGRTTFSIPAANLPDGTRAFSARFDCARPGKPEHGGADWITFNVSPNPVPGFTVGGSIAGLTAAGLELQNFNREILSVPAGSTSFAFGTPLAAGANYNIKVRTQPVNQLCTVAHGSGQVAAAVSNIAVTCQSTLPAVQKLALVVNNSTNNMTILTRNTDSGRLTPLSTIATGSYPLDVVVTPNGQFAYVTNTVSGSVTSYRINGTTVTSIPQSTQYTFNPYGLTVDPNGQFLRVANYNSHTVSSFSIDNATGLLTPRGSVPTGLHPYAVVTHPNGNFVYTIDSTGSSSSGPSISGFSVNPSSGELTSLGQPFRVPALSPLDLVISPNGAFIFATGGQSQVARMSINAATGALTSGPTTTINYATGASCIAIHPTGSHLYVAASGAPAGFIQVFSVDSAGVLTATSQVPSGHGRSCIAVDASGEFMYVNHSDDNAVSTYSISQGGGTLTLLEQDPTGTFPQAIALTP